MRTALEATATRSVKKTASDPELRDLTESNSKMMLRTLTHHGSGACYLANKERVLP